MGVEHLYESTHGSWYQCITFLVMTDIILWEVTTMHKVFLLPAGVLVQHFWQIRFESNADNFDYSCEQHGSRRSTGLLYTSETEWKVCSIKWNTNEVDIPQGIVNWTSKEGPDDYV